MEDLKQHLEKFDVRIESLSGRMEILQDIVLQMKSNFDLFLKNLEKESVLAKITAVADDNLNFFIKKRFRKCQFLDKCTTLVEKVIFHVLRAFMEKGSQPALDIINNFDKMARAIPCPDDKCLGNVVQIFNTLVKLIKNSEESEKAISRELSSLSKAIILKEGNEQEMCDLLKPLSNVIRLKILKSLVRGAKNYTELENDIGVKGGHLLHHLNNLKKTSYITKEVHQGYFSKYSITAKGLKGLKYVSELREVFVIAS